MQEGYNLKEYVLSRGNLIFDPYSIKLMTSCALVIGTYVALDTIKPLLASEYIVIFLFS